ncbi:MAG: hypothetical protein AAGC77_13165 [Pseudomonadota bacterium]
MLFDGMTNLMGSPRAALTFVAVLTLGACATTENAGAPETEDVFWSAYGFMGPAPTGDAELIGTYFGKKACDAAAEEWMSTQVAGNPVYAECFPPELD